MYDEDEQFPSPPPDDDSSAAPIPGDAPGGDGTFEDALLQIVEEIQESSEQIKLQGQALSELDARMRQLEAAPGAEKPDPWNLREADEEATRTQWQALAEWIVWFNQAYAPNASNNLRIPECWYLHPHGRMAMLSLFHAWRAAQYGHKSASADAVYWDTTYMPNAMRLAEEHNGWDRCRTGTHDERTTREATPVRVPVEFGSWLGGAGEPATTTSQIPVVPPAATDPLSATARPW